MLNADENFMRVYLSQLESPDTIADPTLLSVNQRISLHNTFNTESVLCQPLLQNPRSSTTYPFSSVNLLVVPTCPPLDTGGRSPLPIPLKEHTRQTPLYNLAIMF